MNLVKKIIKLKKWTTCEKPKTNSPRRYFGFATELQHKTQLLSLHSCKLSYKIKTNVRAQKSQAITLVANIHITSHRCLATIIIPKCSVKNSNLRPPSMQGLATLLGQHRCRTHPHKHKNYFIYYINDNFFINQI